MAELAFESLVRVVIAIVVLVVLLTFINMLSDIGKQKIKQNFVDHEKVVDASTLNKEGLKSLLNYCYTSYKTKLISTRELCLVMKNADIDKLQDIANNSSNIIASENLSKNVLVYVLPNGDISLE